MPVLKFTYNKALHRRGTRGYQGVCSWHAGECEKKPRWSMYTPMGWQAVCKAGLEAIERRYGKPVKG
ncbi:hypothetical protein [Streptomyces sp. MMBL 11-1]|uniref:hypothetical protein n=1 Tax=Streptomyces sp. MMBL 11-1 TaxID=3026420 RepID=UPI002360F9C2|nr:hypothetical protein [Streptomyces sp. MMBL 11-1]